MRFILPLSIIFVLSFVPCLAQINQATQEDDVANTQCDDYLGRTGDYVNKLKKTVNAKGVIIIYEGKTIKGFYDRNSSSYSYDEYVFPRLGLANELIRTIKKRLTFLGTDEKDIVFIKGGFREKLAIEFWIVPNGATPPQPTPTLKKMRYRNGKPRGYCTTMS